MIDINKKYRTRDGREVRIEKLEAALRDCMEMAEVHEIPFRDRVMYISDVARKALEVKDDVDRNASRQRQLGS